jgi:hypothetical protein
MDFVISIYSTKKSLSRGIFIWVHTICLRHLVSNDQTSTYYMVYTLSTIPEISGQARDDKKMKL